MSNTLVGLIEEHWHEVTLDQIKPGDPVIVAYGPNLGASSYRATPGVIAEWKSDLIDAWKNGDSPDRFFLPEPPAPAPEYEPGTLACITRTNGEMNNAVRVRGLWAIDGGNSLPYLIGNDEVSHVEVVVLPDGTRPASEVTEEDGQAVREIERANSKRDGINRGQDMADLAQWHLNTNPGGRA